MDRKNLSTLVNREEIANSCPKCANLLASRLFDYLQIEWVGVSSDWLTHERDCFKPKKGALDLCRFQKHLSVKPLIAIWLTLKLWVRFPLQGEL